MKNNTEQPAAKKITIEERIELLKQQAAQAEQQVQQSQSILLKCAGAIEVLESMQKE